MLRGLLIGLAISAVFFVIFLIVFSKKLREMREQEGSVYQRLFKRNKQKEV